MITTPAPNYACRSLATVFPGLIVSQKGVKCRMAVTMKLAEFTNLDFLTPARNTAVVLRFAAASAAGGQIPAEKTEAACDTNG